MAGDDDAGLTFTAYAERIGRSQPYISKLVAEGVIHGDAILGEGRSRRIIPPLADAQRADAAVRPAATTDRPAAGSGTLNVERTRLTTAQALRTELEIEVRRGELIPRSAVAAILPALARRYVDQLGQVVRDTISDDVERALLLGRIAAQTETFIFEALSNGGAPPAG